MENKLKLFSVEDDIVEKEDSPLAPASKFSMVNQQNLARNVLNNFVNNPVKLTQYRDSFNDNRQYYLSQSYRFDIRNTDNSSHDHSQHTVNSYNKRFSYIVRDNNNRIIKNSPVVLITRAPRLSLNHVTLVNSPIIVIDARKIRIRRI